MTESKELVKSIVSELMSRGFTQQELADICQVSQSAVSSWSSGKKSASKKNLDILAALAKETKGLGKNDLDTLTKAAAIGAASLIVGGVIGALFKSILKDRG